MIARDQIPLARHGSADDRARDAVHENTVGRVAASDCSGGVRADVIAPDNGKLRDVHSTKPTNGLKA